MEGLLIESVAAELDRDRQRRADRIQRLPRSARKVRRPAGSWVLSGAAATWLGR
jgi:hypothetical protein